MNPIENDTDHSLISRFDEEERRYHKDLRKHDIDPQYEYLPVDDPRYDIATKLRHQYRERVQQLENEFAYELPCEGWEGGPPVVDGKILTIRSAVDLVPYLEQTVKLVRGGRGGMDLDLSAVVCDEVAEALRNVHRFYYTLADTGNDVWPVTTDKDPSDPADAEARLDRVIAFLQAMGQKKRPASSNRTKMRMARDKRLKKLWIENGRRNEWVKLTELANEDPEINSLGLAGLITKDIVRAAVSPPKTRGKKG